MRDAKGCAGLTVLALALGSGGAPASDDLDFPPPPPAAPARTMQPPAAAAPRYEAPRAAQRTPISAVRSTSRRALCPEGPPFQILKYMEQSLQVVADESKPEEVRHAFEEAFTDILAAGERLRNLPGATAAEKKEARQYEASVLYQGAAKDLQLPNYRERLQQLADTLYAEDKRSEVAALASFLTVKSRYELDGSYDARALDDIKALYIARFPRDEAATDLIAEVAQAAEQQGDLTRARTAYKMAEKEFPRSELALRLPKIADRLDLYGKLPDLQGFQLGSNAQINLRSGNRGRVTVVHFWSMYKPGTADLEALRALHKQRGQDIDMIGVPIDSDQARLAEYVRENELDWPQVDGARESRELGTHPWAARYAIAALPMTMILDKQGRVKAMNVRSEQLERAIDEIAADRKYSAPPVRTARRPAEEGFNFSK